MEVENPRPRIFLLSPASTDGLRARQLTSPRAGFGAARRYRGPEGVTVEEAFTFMSSLYFRGKITYPGFLTIGVEKGWLRWYKCCVGSTYTAKEDQPYDDRV